MVWFDLVLKQIRFVFLVFVLVIKHHKSHAPKVTCSQKSHAPKVPSSQSLILPKSHAPKVPCSQSPMLPKSPAPKVPVSQSPMLPMSHAPKYMESHGEPLGGLLSHRELSVCEFVSLFVKNCFIELLKQLKINKLGCLPFSFFLRSSSIFFQVVFLVGSK